MFCIFYGVKYNSLWSGTKGPSDLALFSFLRLFSFYTSPCIWLLKQQNNGILISLSSSPLSVFIPLQSALGYRWSLDCALHPGHSRPMYHWVSSLSSNGHLEHSPSSWFFGCPFINCIFGFSFFPTHTSIFCPQDSFLCSFLFFSVFLFFFYIVLSLGDPLHFVVSTTICMQIPTNPFLFFPLLSLTSFLNPIYPIAHRTLPLDGLISDIIIHSVSRRDFIIPLPSQTNLFLIQVAHFYKWNHSPNF